MVTVAFVLIVHFLKAAVDLQLGWPNSVLPPPNVTLQKKEEVNKKKKKKRKSSKKNENKKFGIFFEILQVSPKPLLL